ncbi:MAG: transposase [Candidatus Omnitrophica bacterium]|nr:transposase [Candidatus Omnitrophota bacterium]
MAGEEGKKKRFNREFKISAVKMVTEGGHKAAEVARSLGIHANQLYNWKHKFSDDGEKAFPGKGHLTELAALRRKLRDVEMERDILKKAVGIFSKPTENGTGS